MIGRLANCSVQREFPNDYQQCYAEVSSPGSFVPESVSASKKVTCNAMMLISHNENSYYNVSYDLATMYFDRTRMKQQLATARTVPCQTQFRKTRTENRQFQLFVWLDGYSGCTDPGKTTGVPSSPLSFTGYQKFNKQESPE